MTTVLGLILGAGAGVSAPGAVVAAKGPVSAWVSYQQERSLECFGDPLGRMETPEEVSLGGFKYRFEGGRVTVRRETARTGTEVRLGVLSGIKELDDKTKANLDRFFERFKKEGVEGVLVGGDNAEDGEHLADVFTYLAAQGLPTYVVIGNWEPRAPFNRALREASEGHPNLINMQLARRVDAEGFDVVSLGGYHDKQYVRTTGACLYKPEELVAVEALLKEADDPVLLLMHGPPHQAGKDALDFVPEAGNTGDPAIASLIKDSGGKVAFGVHGHILEAALKANAEALAAQGEVVAPSMPGFGGSPGPGDFDTPYDLVNVCHSVLEQLGGDVTVIGLSSM